MISTAPIVLFVFARPDHTRRTLEALAANQMADQSDLIIYADAARNASEESSVHEVRALIRCVSGFRSVKVVEREINYGLARNIIEGVTSVCKQYGRVIVLEDDLVTSRYFLRYMNEALEKYEKNERVISAHGYVYPVKGVLPETFFLKGADCWGWATWKRAWDLFEPDGRKLFGALKQKGLIRRFDYNGAYPYTKMLSRQIDAKNDSWAIRWYASALLHDKFTLYPGKSLVHNIGNDDSGTHCGKNLLFDTCATCVPVHVGGISIEEHSEALVEFELFFRSLRTHLLSRIFNFLSSP